MEYDYDISVRINISHCVVCDEVLEAIGAIAVQRSGRISVVGAADLELAILKPVLMGRRTVVKVEYDRVKQPDQGVTVSVSANPKKAR